MSPVSKSLVASMAIALVVAGTLALRDRSVPEPRPQLTSAQLAMPVVRVRGILSLKA